MLSTLKGLFDGVLHIGHAIPVVSAIVAGYMRNIIFQYPLLLSLFFLSFLCSNRECDGSGERGHVSEVYSQGVSLKGFALVRLLMF